MSNNTIKKVALCGNPNCGKSSLFNHLTGLKQKITNIPGTTIDRKSAVIHIDGTQYQLIDTPGTYSVNPKSKDEEVALDLFKPNHPERPDLIIYVADAHNLKRNLFYFSQLSELNIPIILLLNMVDVSKAAGIDIDTARLEKELGIPVLETNARVGTGLGDIEKAISGTHFTTHYPFTNEDKSDIQLRYERISGFTQKDRPSEIEAAVNN